MSPEMKIPIPKADHKPLGVDGLLTLLENCKLNPENSALFLAELARSAATLKPEDVQKLQKKYNELWAEKNKSA